MDLVANGPGPTKEGIAGMMKQAVGIGSIIPVWLKKCQKNCCQKLVGLGGGGKGGTCTTA